MNNYENLIYKLLDDRYRLTGIIGTGGMAVVYEAEDITMLRKVAVKMLKDEIKEDAESVKRFINESKAVAMLSHPNIVQIYDVSVRGSDNYQYIVMELIDGITLKDYIVKKGRLNWREAISYAEQILNALKHAHGKGIIHRDIKPQNIMLLRNGNLKITDFGIAKMQGSEPLTMTDKAIGTVHYISPEQASGVGSITNVSDIYSTGVLLYEMTTGELPFNGDTAIQVAMKQINDVPKNPRALNPEIPRGLAQIILKAMSKAPRDRYQSAEEMINQLSIISANPAVLFNSGVAGVIGGGGISNLPIPADGGLRQNSALVNGNRGRTDITASSGNRNKQKNIDEEAMRRKGRSPKKTPKRKQSRSMFPIISGVTLAFLIILGIAGVNIVMTFINFEGKSQKADTIIIPEYVGKEYDKILDDMREKRLTTGVITEKINDDFEKGQIIFQNPPGGQLKKYPSASSMIPIDFDVSLGKASERLEDWSAMDAREIKIMLEKKRIEVYEEPIEHDTIMSGYIISTDPMPGIDPKTGEPKILEAGDKIILYVSIGKKEQIIEMPRLVGLNDREAKQILAGSDIVIKKINMEHSDTVPRWTVISQDIPAGTPVAKKSTRVTITVSLGPVPVIPPPTTTEAPVIIPEE